MISPIEIERLVLAAIPDAEVRVTDMTGTGDHFEVKVVSAGFRGKSILDQHKMVFEALEKEMENRIHAVKIKTQTPVENN
ncbi:MAG: BolA family transcriptional regulator [Candidatus Omnitrophica bacterium]|nr:BolA family transcriptional regulator [Candidatus Omnitrophota bacterium]